MNPILERILNEKPREEGVAYREFESKQTGFATNNGNELRVTHYIAHYEHNDGVTESHPQYTYTLTIREYGGVWWIVWWSAERHFPNWIHLNYATADEALDAMLAISDAIIA